MRVWLELCRARVIPIVQCKVVRTAGLGPGVPIKSTVFNTIEAASQVQECLEEIRHGGESREGSETRFTWTVQKKEELVEMWSEQESLSDISSHFYRDRVEKEKGWTEIAEALEIPGANASLSQAPQTSQM
ncbi:hypothetical protein NFI96_014060 [Prochilodus magdalenae]|nr:hypothetical protein NFI96_014060 [Prochilodus magdalenae]